MAAGGGAVLNLRVPSASAAPARRCGTASSSVRCGSARGAVPARRCGTASSSVRCGSARGAVPARRCGTASSSVRCGSARGAVPARRCGTASSSVRCGSARGAVPARQAGGGLEEDHYRTLRLEPGATRGEVKKAFHRLALQYHPDIVRDGHQDDGIDFERINVAYQKVMSNMREAEATLEYWRRRYGLADEDLDRYRHYLNDEDEDDWFSDL